MKTPTLVTVRRECNRRGGWHENRRAVFDNETKANQFRDYLTDRGIAAHTPETQTTGSGTVLGYAITYTIPTNG